jgi:hypothetical protein
VWYILAATFAVRQTKTILARFCEAWAYFVNALSAVKGHACSATFAQDGIRHLARPIRDVPYATRRGSGAEGERIPGLRQEGLEKWSFSSAAPSVAINRQRRRVRGILKCYSRGDRPLSFGIGRCAVVFFRRRGILTVKAARTQVNTVCRNSPPHMT